MKPFGGVGIPGRERDNLWEQLLNGGYFPINDSDEWITTVDVAETKDDILIKADLPVIDVRDIHIDILDNLLTIKGKVKKEDEKGDHSYCVDWYIGDCRSFRHTLTLPADVQDDKARATFNKGILEIVLPKMRESKNKKINVEIK